MIGEKFPQRRFFFFASLLPSTFIRSRLRMILTTQLQVLWVAQALEPPTNTAKSWSMSLKPFSSNKIRKSQNLNKYTNEKLGMQQTISRPGLAKIEERPCLKGVKTKTRLSPNKRFHVEVQYNLVLIVSTCIVHNIVQPCHIIVTYDQQIISNIIANTCILNFNMESVL